MLDRKTLGRIRILANAFKGMKKVLQQIEFEHDELILTQKVVSIEKLLNMLYDEPIDQEPRPLVVMYEDKFYLMSGHHRLLWHTIWDKKMLCDTII